MVERTPEEGKEEPKIIEPKFVDEKHIGMQLYIPQGTVHYEDYQDN
jgi:hypothetical protein